jgi:ubiquinone/menaquinone biosynthesis C-methylase UbiE
MVRVGMAHGMKSEVEEYWSRYPPGIDSPGKDIPFGSRPFYEAIDKKRYHREPYIPQLMSSLECSGYYLLEVGCGLGTDSRQFARLGAKVVAIDLSKSNALISKRGLEVSGLEGEVLVADAENLPFRDSSFNLVYSFGVLHHTPDTQMAINEIYRTLKHGGRTLTMLYHKGLAYYWIILRHGFLSLELFRSPMEKIISKRYDHTPLSKMYTKRQAKRLFRQFYQVKLKCLNFGAIQEHPQLNKLWKLYKTFPILERMLGSFLIISAKKRLWK